MLKNSSPGCAATPPSSCAASNDKAVASAAVGETFTPIEVCLGTVTLRGDYVIGGKKNCDLNSGLSSLMDSVLSVLHNKLAQTRADLSDDRKNEFVFAFRLCLEEVLTNHLKHGNAKDPAKKTLLDVDYHFGPDGTLSHVTLTSSDEGRGYDVQKIPDCRCDENLEKFGGRGHLLIQAYSNRIQHFNQGSICRIEIKLPEISS